MAALTLTAPEQLILELVNRARLDPKGEAARYGIDLNAGLAAGTITATAKAPLAPNNLLVDSARDHSQWMIANDVFSHTGAGGSSPHGRMVAAGYVFSGSFASGENIAIVGTSGAINLTPMTLDLHENLFKSPPHRTNILSTEFRELGPGIWQGVFNFDTGPFNSVDLTENFARSGTKLFVTGVVYNDNDNDNFYDVGEAHGGVSIQVRRSGSLLGSDTSEAAGGYAIGVAAGSCEVRFSGGGLPATVNATVDASSVNAKIDLLGTNEILCSTNVTLGAGAKLATLLGVAGLSATGNTLANTLDGNKGANMLSGLDGNDILRGFAGADRLLGGNGIDKLTGGGGSDTLTGGPGADVFDYNVLSETGKTSGTRDHIKDFLHLSDDIDLSTLDARTGGANDAFSFIGKSAFGGTPGQLHYFQQNPAGTASDLTIIEGDVNGDRVADFQIDLAGLLTLTTADFIL